MHRIGIGCTAQAFNKSYLESQTERCMDSDESDGIEGVCVCVCVEEGAHCVAQQHANSITEVEHLMRPEGAHKWGVPSHVALAFSQLKYNCLFLIKITPLVGSTKALAELFFVPKNLHTDTPQLPLFELAICNQDTQAIRCDM